MNRLLLVDGSAYFYRAFWAVKDLRTSGGHPTNAAFGFVSMLAKLLKTHAGEPLAMIFDAPGPTFRHERYPEYKATRERIPEDLVQQLPYVKELPRAYAVPTFEVAGVEADDVIGTLATRAAREGREVVIVTGDKDFMQLVTKEVETPGPGIVLYDEMKDRRIGIREVREKFGVPPERVVDVLALLGDASDNIPGVKGIGEKTAPGLIAEFGSIEDLYRRLDEVKRAPVRQALERDRENAILSRELATIRRDVPVDADLGRLVPGKPDRAKLVKMFRELEFTRFLKELEEEAPASAGTSEYCAVLDARELEALAARFSKGRRLSVDLETTSEDPVRAQVVGISLCADEREAYYVPVGHRYLGAPEQIPAEKALAILKPLFENPAVGKIGQNIKYDALVLRRHGVTLAPIEFDTMVGAYLIDPDGGPFNLESLTRKWLGEEKRLFTDLTGKGKAQVTFDEVPVESARDYSCQDSDVVWRLTPRLEKRIRDDGLEKILEMEIPLIEVLLRMELNGVRIDAEVLRRLSRDFEKKLAGLRQEICAGAGEEFNIDSPKQLQRILFEKLGLTPGRKTKTGRSTDMEVLEQLAGEHPLPAKVLEHRVLTKLKGTYIDALPALVNPETGRIHTSYNQAVAGTGRLSSSDPNLQNIPVRTPEGREIRKAFVPEPGWTFVSADYSQIELRLVAHLSKDPIMTRAFREGADIHAATAAEVFGAGNVTPELRRRAKEINFGIIYGISGFGLAKRIGIDPRTAQEYIDRYLARYRGVKEYIDRSLVQARKDGYVTTMFGRRRYVPAVASQNKMVRSAAERVAINAPVQGAAADLIKIAMVRVSERFDRERLRAKLILQVHDELVVEAPEGEADRALAAVREEMEGAHPLDVPLKVDAGRGPNWADLK
ncbi:MAG: DNA polymerase I [Planctomycetes bacterium]|nr:DNA polymerase I [Planctomycetota bacterium]